VSRSGIVCFRRLCLQLIPPFAVVAGGKLDQLGVRDQDLPADPPGFENPGRHEVVDRPDREREHMGSALSVVQQPRVLTGIVLGVGDGLPQWI
jgi:hypothetical protein